MGSAHDMDRQLEEFARHLAQRQKEVLAVWRTAVAEDPALHTASSLSKARFDDHIPEVLDAFASQLKAWPGRGVALAEDQQQQAGERHGAMRNQSLQTLEKGVSALRAMLNDLLSLARLEAGQERRAVAAFHASDLLETLCENARPLAAERGLYLRAEGSALRVQGDAVKVQRIAQNLLMNALKYTREGGVTVAWGPRPESSAGQWFLRVSDTGPGVEASRPPIVQELKAITEDERAKGTTDRSAGDARVGEAEDALRSLASNSNGPASTQGALTQGPGEGVGLSIVKQLCELLDATLELESTPDSGTTIRVLLPAHYETN